MATSKKAPKAKTSTVELRRWCVEMAIRWPTYTLSYGASNGLGYSNSTIQTVDHDVIARAEKILKWVTA